MERKSMGELIAARRKEKSMTQKELADKLNITDKAVSKWERHIAFPDMQNIPKLAEIPDISIDELLSGKPTPPSGHKGAEYLIAIVLKAVPQAMGVAVTVLAAQGQFDTRSGFTMLGIGLACAGMYLPKEKV